MGRKRWIFALCIVLAAGRYGAWPRRADLRAFAPAHVARLETGMWRDYYEKRYHSLLGRLYTLYRVEYGSAIADVTREVFGVASPEARAAGVLRAEMMAYRDARGTDGMEPADWSHLEEGLTRSYTLLRAALASPLRGSGRED